MSEQALRKADKSLTQYLSNFSTMLGRNRAAAEQGYYYESLFDFAVKECKIYRPAKLTKEEKDYVENAIRQLRFIPQVKQCFYNSQMLATQDSGERIKYVEGYGLSLIPTMHGWCEINGKVIDLTWKKKNGTYVLGTFDEERAYAGVVFPTEYVLKSMLKLGYAGTLIEDYERKFPVMRDKWDNGKNLLAPSNKQRAK